MAVRSLVWALLASFGAVRTYAQTVQNAWVLPESPDYTTTFTQGESVTLQWQSNLQDAFSTYCEPCNLSAVDLWVVGGSDDKYQFQIASAVNVRTTTSIDWTILLPDSDLQAQQTWSLRFVPSNTTPHGTGDGAEISSPQFQVVAAASTTTTSATSTPTPTSTSSSPDTAATTTTSAGNSGDSGLSAGASAGIGVGVGLAALLVFGAIAFWFIRRRRQQHPKPPSAPAELEAAQRQPPPSSQNPAIGSYYSPEEQKQPGHPGSPAPAYATPISEAASIPKEQVPIAHELNARVDPVELEGSAGTR